MLGGGGGHNGGGFGEILKVKRWWSMVVGECHIVGAIFQLQLVFEWI